MKQAAAVRFEEALRLMEATMKLREQYLDAAAQTVAWLTPEIETIIRDGKRRIRDENRRISDLYED